MLALRRRSLLAVVLATGLMTYLSREAWLPSIAYFLIRTDPPQAAEIVVVLAGDPAGGRILEAVRLVEAGYAPSVLVNGTGSYFGARECDEAVRFAHEQGFNQIRLEPFCFEASSTRTESIIVDNELRRRGIREALIVTSDYHTRRSAMIFRRSGSGQVFYRFAAAATPGFSPDTWWRDRESRALVLLECLKSLNSWLEDPL